jgi:hypothetical protein
MITIEAIINGISFCILGVVIGWIIKAELDNWRYPGLKWFKHNVSHPSQDFKKYMELIDEWKADTYKESDGE